MNNLPIHNHQNYYLSQLSSINVPYEYNYKKAIGNKEILFFINCKDGIRIIYVDPDCIYVSYTY